MFVHSLTTKMWYCPLSYAQKYSKTSWAFFSCFLTYGQFSKMSTFPKSSLTSWKYEIGPFDPKHECFLLFKEDGIASLCTWYKILYFHVHCLLICWLMNIQIYVHCLLMCWFRDNFKTFQNSNTLFLKCEIESFF